MDYTYILRSDDRSDSGVGSLRAGSYASGDERSGSRSSALSSTDDTQQGSNQTVAFNPLSVDFNRNSGSSDGKTNAAPKPVCVWRDPSLLVAEPSVHQIQSVQHRSLLMSHSSPPAPAVPPVSSPVRPVQHLPPPLPGLYAHLPEAIWKQQYAARTQHAVAEGDRDRQERVFREHREVEVSELVNQHKQKEKLERERQERHKQMERERECNERNEHERRAAEQAVHKHFVESLRLAEHKRNLPQQWNINILNSLPPPPEEVRKRAEQEAAHQQQIIASERGSKEPHERSYLPGLPRSASGFNVDYTSSAHGRAKQLPEKPLVHTLPKAEPNFNLFGYPAYQPRGYLAHEGNKVKQEQSKTPLTSLASISVRKSALNLERDRDTLPNPPPLTSDVKSSVIVKNEGKSPQHHESSKLPRQHSPSPKHHLISTQQMHFHKTSGYEFHPLPRTHLSPSHSPHHLNSHHMAGLEAQNLVGKTQPSPQSQRQLPVSGSAELRFPFPYAIPGVSYGIAPGSGNIKPKVSSPAPGHMYMKPSSSSQPSMNEPPPAHSSSPNLGYGSRLYSPKVPPTGHTPTHPTSCQTQPLDLGVSNSVSPKRKGVSSLPTSESSKRQRCDPPSSYSSLPQHGLGHLHMTQNTSSLPFLIQPLLSRVGEPSPLIASAATTITTVMNTVAYCSPAVTMTTSLPAATPVAERPASRDNRPNSAPHPQDSPLPLVTCSSPTVEDMITPPCTPVKASSIDSDKSNSPGPMRTPASYPVHKLKKAWLQRHSGEDGTEDNSVIAGSGSCITPVTIVSPSASASFSNKDCVNSSSDGPIDRVQAEVGGSVGKCRQFSSGNRKGSPVLPTIKGNSGVFLNGHANELPSSKPSVDDDSSSSGTDRELKTSRKRKPPKVKKKKGSGAALRKAAAEELKRKRLAAMAASESSGSDKESATDKESDSGATKKAANNKEPRKRGRRPKGSKFLSNSEPRQKKSQGQPHATLRDPFLKPSVSQLKKSGESFLQDGPCFEVAPKLAKCRECRWTPNQRSKNTPNIFCRFYAFRRLRYTKNGLLAIAGFSDPHQDAAEEDLRLWLPFPDTRPADLDLDVSRLILMQVGDQFCDLLQQESACPEIHMSDDKTIAWKRVVQGVREMCDVCETTLFNFHWACGKCGFVVCIDCYKGRKNGTVKVWLDSDTDGKDEYLWLSCTNRQAHEQEKLMLTQIIAADSLLTLGRRSHEARALWGIPQYCGCDVSKVVPSQDLKEAAKDLIKNLVKTDLLNGTLKLKEENVTSNGTTKDDKSSLNWLAEVALSNEDKMSSSDTDLEEKDGNYSTLRELLIRPSNKTSNSRSSSPASTTSLSAAGHKGLNKSGRLDTLDEVISSVIEHSVQRKEETPADSQKPTPELEHFVRRYNWFQKDRDPLPIRIMTHTESKILYPDLPHAWLCDGKLLRLTDPQHVDNGRIFADQWKRGQPVLVSDVNLLLDGSLWHPDSFARDFGDDKNDLINCMTGNLVPNQPMRKFWEGFENFSKRLKDEHGNAMLLKLKDWPPGEDFAEMLPSRFKDLMKVLPMPEYTNRTGYLNLASRLPDCFVRPDLGPKMYNAYGSALHPSKGTTNLHLDISDAVNVMVYVGIPEDADDEEYIKEAFRAIDEAGCDILTRRRVRDRGELPGALWHIYHSRDADKIRDLLNKVSLERGNRLEPHHDPIHDQSWYLDSDLRERLYKEYSVEGYAIVQCLGDAVFIPAGAPHQVRNLHNCIKVAEDFVSPENVSHCFHLTQEFRELSNDHTNHEDKLQIKNIIYHAVKDSLAVLSQYTEGQLKERVLSSLEKGSAIDKSNDQTSPVEVSSNGKAEVPVKDEPVS